MIAEMTSKRTKRTATLAAAAGRAHRGAPAYVGQPGKMIAV